MFSTPKSRGELFLASSLRDGLEDNDLRQVETLLSIKEADPNVLIPNHGISPFHLVIGNESEEFAERVSQLFLRHGGNPNVKSVDGMTPVHVAAAWGRVGVLKLLLAHGGDPLCLDDEGRSPFHYAFDGAYYDVIAVLGKYCANSQADDNDDNDADERPKYKLTLDKILVNKGNVVAEYVSSTSSFKSALKSETKDEKPNETSEHSISDLEQRLVGKSLEKFNRSRHNVTLRRHQRRSSPNLPLPVYCPGVRSSDDEEKVLVGNIISRLSTTLTNETSSTDGGRSFIKKRILRDGVDGKRLKKTAHLKFKSDESIISKSPNLKIWTINDKTPNHVTNEPSSSRKNKSSQKISSRKKVRQRSADGRGKSGASSTPRRKERRRFRLHESPEKLDTKNLPSTPEAKETPTIYHRFADERLNLSFSGDVEFLARGRRPNVQNEAKNIAVKLEDRMADEDLETGSEEKINDDMKNEDQGNYEEQLDAARDDENESIASKRKDEDDGNFFESPGSSNPLSFYSLEQKTNSTLNGNQAAEEANILLEIEQAYEEKCPTPPASISLLGSPEGIYDKTDIAHSDYSSGGSSSFCEYHEAEQRTMSLWSRSESFVSVDEEYTYEDEEEGIAFIERRLRVIPSSVQEEMNRAKEESSWIDRLGELSIDTKCHSGGSTMPATGMTKTSRGIDDERELRDRLHALGEVPGPITQTTYNVYLKRLWRLERAQVHDDKKLQYNGEPPAPQLEERGCTVPKYLLVVDWVSREDYYKNLEEKAFSEYAVANPKRKYRGGVSKTSFCYLLLDPRLTQDLPRSSTDLKVEERWQRFLKAVFYVGKGKAARPAAHLYDAFNVWSRGKSENDTSRKIRRILEIWRSGQGVVCLHVFYHTMAEEACSREASMIDALGTKHLTNCVHGTYYGYAATAMSQEEKRSLGKFLLYRAMQILMHEGERQLFPRNVFL